MTAPAVAFTAPEIKVNGTLLSAEQLNSLRSARVHTELCLVGRTTLVFDDMGYALSSSNAFALGVSVEIQIDSTAVFNGMITGSSLEHDRGVMPRLVVTADDRAFRLGLTQKMKSFVNTSYSDVITKLARSAGLTASVTSDGVVREHVIQRTSDLAFLDMIVRRMNMVWFVEGNELKVVKGAPEGRPVALDGMNELQEFSVRASGLRPLEVDVQGWDLKQKTKVVGQATGAQAPTTASSNFVADYVAAKPGSKLSTASTAVLTTAANPLDQAEAEAIASAHVAALSSAAVTARGTVEPGTAKVKLNGQVQVSNVGPMSGTYTVTSVEHVYDSRGLVTHFVCGSLRPSGLVDTLGESSGVDDGLIVRTLTTGVVTNTKDPNQLGRVKVKIAGTDESIESDWARVMTLGGGPDRGVVFHPEVNDEVVLGFERGDTRRPVVLGGLVNGKDALASKGQILSPSGAVDFRRITSRQGHTIEIAEGDGTSAKPGHIALALKGGTNKIRLGDDALTIDMPSGKPFTITIGQAKIAISNSGEISIEGMKIALKADTDIELTANASLKGSANATLDLKGQASAKLSGAMVSVEGEAQAALKGAIVMIN